VGSTAQYWAVSGQYYALMSSQWTLLRNIEQSVDTTAQYWAVNGEYCAILSSCRRCCAIVTVNGLYHAVLSSQWTVLRNSEQSMDCNTQYWAVSGQYCAILSSQWTLLRNIEQSAVRRAQYCAVSGQYCTIFIQSSSVCPAVTSSPAQHFQLTEM